MLGESLLSVVLVLSSGCTPDNSSNFSVLALVSLVLTMPEELQLVKLDNGFSSSSSSFKSCSYLTVTAERLLLAAAAVVAAAAAVVVVATYTVPMGTECRATFVATDRQRLCSYCC